MLKSLIEKFVNVSDQLILTFWSLLLTVILSRTFDDQNFYLFNIFYVIQSVVLLIINSSIGQLILIDGRKFTLKSIFIWFLILGLLVAIIFIIIVKSEILRIDLNSYQLLLVAYYLGVFSLFELIRRLCYAHNRFKLSLFYSILIVFVGLVTILVLNTINELNFINLISLLSIVYTINCIFLFCKLNVKDVIKELHNLRFKNILVFNKWLFPGILLYIITNQLFLIYLNNVGDKELVTSLRLLESVFGIILVFVAAFENYFISSLKSGSLRNIFKVTLPIWGIFYFGMFILIFFLEKIIMLLFSTSITFSYQLLFVLFSFYSLTVFSRVLVIYLRINRNNNIIFISNTINAIIVVWLIYNNYLFSFTSLYYIKILFTLISLIIYTIPLFLKKCQKG